MAKRIIILGKANASAEDAVSVAFWFVITSGKQAVSSGSMWAGASAGENSAIQSGDVIEETRSFNFPKNTLIASMKDTLEKAWTVRDGQIAGKGPATFNGVFFDSVSGWSA